MAPKPQSLEHYQDISEAMMKGCTTDTVYLDFAEALDKVDHNIVLQTLRAHGISGKNRQEGWRIPKGKEV